MGEQDTRAANPLRHRLSRRGFVVGAGAVGAGLVIGRMVPVSTVAAEEGVAGNRFEPFVRISPQDTVTVIVKHLEMGQGISTGLAMLVAEELDASWAQMRVEFAPVDPSIYANKGFHGIQGTGNSTSLASSFDQYRAAGALARATLLAAASKAWAVSADEIEVQDGRLVHPEHDPASFGAFAEQTRGVGEPEDIAVKDPSAFIHIGKRQPRLDSAAKLSGETVFGSDVQLDGMLVAVVARPPRFGATVATVDDREARQIDGVVDVLEIPEGVAVLARSTWPALKARKKLSITWDDRKAEKRSSRQLWTDYHDRVSTQGVAVRSEGSTESALKGAAMALEADFNFPFLAHAPMEPLSSVVKFTGDSATVWTASQIPSLDRANVSEALGLAPEQVTIETLHAGGSFGRRSCFDSHHLVEASNIARTHGQGLPIKVIWTRDDDIRGGYYRPMVLHHVRASLDKNGLPTAWHHRIVSQSIFAGTPFEADMLADGVDSGAVQGVRNMPYAIPNLGIELHTVDTGVPVLRWRSMGHSHSAYVVETFIDELAATAGRDAVEYRLEMLKDAPRLNAVLSLAAEKAGWGEKPAENRFRGVAAHESFGTSIAKVAEISVDDAGRLKVERVICAVDCGLVVNPDQVRAQIEGGIGFGLGAALRNAITLDDGRVEQADFDSYEPLRMRDMPEVEVHIVESSEAPSGVGEAAVPTIGPAVANAIFAGTGRRIRALPFLAAKRQNG